MMEEEVGASKCVERTEEPLAQIESRGDNGEGRHRPIGSKDDG